MLDIKYLRENPERVKENIKKKYQDKKLPLVDEVIDLDQRQRSLKQEGDDLRSLRNSKSSEIGIKIQNKLIDEANVLKQEVSEINNKLVLIEKEEQELNEKIYEIMIVLPNIIADTVPIGKDDSDNVELERYGDFTKPSFEVPHHADIMKKLNGLDKESAARTSGHGFYYLRGDIALLHSALLQYARDFMMEKGFEYVIPPFMIRSDVVSGVMSFDEMSAMMYKVEDEDLFLIGTSEHSMIGMFKDQIVDVNELPIKMTSYSPCFRKEVGAHGIEERGIFRVHQFEKQEMIILSKPEDSLRLYEEMADLTVEVFKNLEIPVRKLECCSGDLADLKVKSCDVEAWSPRQDSFFEVGSCSTLGDAQARRLKIRFKGVNGNELVHTLNNTVLASPRGLIAFVENHVQEDGRVYIPEVLRRYMNNKEYLLPKSNK